MIDLTIHDAPLESAAAVARDKSIRIPTFKQMRDPSLIPDSIKQQLASVGLWDLDPLNLFRITWKNEPTPSGGGFGGVNYFELPSELTGTEPASSCSRASGSRPAPTRWGRVRLPRAAPGHRPVRSGDAEGGMALDRQLLPRRRLRLQPAGVRVGGHPSRGDERERFEWLESVAGEIIKTPGSESNVKEIFDKCNELRASGEDLVIFNQFDEFGNYLWHYSVTGPAMVEVLEQVMGPRDTFRGVTLTTGSAGTIARGDYLKQVYPTRRSGR